MTPACRRAARSGISVPAGLPWLASVAGKLYFEVTVVEAAGDVDVGWAGTSFVGTVVGGDKEGASWSVFKDGHCFYRRAFGRGAARDRPPMALSP